MAENEGTTAVENPVDLSDPVHQQATAIAEAILPQLEPAIQARVDAAVESMREETLAVVTRGMGQVAAGLRPPTNEASERSTAPRPFASLGEQLMAIASAAAQGATVDPRLMEIGAVSGMSEGVPADGGFLLQDTFVNDIFRLVHDTGLVASRLPRPIPLGTMSTSIKMPGIDETSRANGSRWGGLQAYWVEEGEQPSDTKVKFQRIALELNKLMALAYLTGEQMRHTPVVERIVTDGFAEEFGFKLDDAGIRGSGVGQPLGVLNSDALITVAKETGQAADTIVFENIVKMWSRLWARSRGNAVWFINQDVEPQLYTLSLAVGTGGVPVYLPAGGLSGSQYGTLFGRPVVPIEQCSTLGDLGDVILADMSQYWRIEGGAAQYASSMHVKFTTDEQAFRGIYETDFRPTWTSALTPYKGSNTISPFVTLAARA